MHVKEREKNKTKQNIDGQSGTIDLVILLRFDGQYDISMQEFHGSRCKFFVLCYCRGASAITYFPLRVAIESVRGCIYVKSIRLFYCLSGI